MAKPVPETDEALTRLVETVNDPKESPAERSRALQRIRESDSAGLIPPTFLASWEIGRDRERPAGNVTHYVLYPHQYDRMRKLLEGLEGREFPFERDSGGKVRYRWNHGARFPLVKKS